MTGSFDIQTSPISPGITLVEAGAGTGKTYALTRTVLRQAFGETPPAWQEQAGSVYVTFLPAVLPETTEIGGEVGTKPALSRHQVDILHKCREDSALVSLMAVAGRSDRTKFRHQVLNALLEAELIEMTIPDKPRSSKQKYRLTEKGRNMLAAIEGGAK